jgi:hypothetical protein
VSGFVASEKEATAHLVFTVNDQSTVADFPADSNIDFVQPHKYTVGDAADVRAPSFSSRTGIRNPTQGSTRSSTPSTRKWPNTSPEVMRPPAS